MSLATFIEFVVNTLSLGSLYALLSLGLVFVFGIMEMVNFAYGEYITVSAYILYLLGINTSLPWPLVFLLGILGGAAISVISEIVAFRPFRGRSVEALLVTSFAVSLILQYTAQITISPRSKPVPLPGFFNQSVNVAGVVTPIRSLLLIAVTVLLLAGFSLLMKKTVLGIAMRAAAEDFTTARLMGVPANLIISCAFAISGVLAGVVAIFWVGRSGSAEPLMGQAPLLISFIVVVIGGMHSLVGSVVGGFIYAAIANVLTLVLPTSLLSFREAIMFAIVIIFLVLKPAGLFRGSYVEERVG
ncbi:MAG: branched-chain amino acid ABC transporter permease [Bifidobacteriaceae bacterium]|jgi:branched-chain amino acid transport system permease protein|nr:branched-chain amino acid ABC transporter permease [Bifidobacteriaceae bacterium]